MSKFTEKEIEEKVGEMLEKLKEADLMFIPIDVYRIAKYMGFSLYQEPMDRNVSGLIVVSNKDIKGFSSRKLIVVNEKDSPLRKRFTIAHELGHYVLNGSQNECYAHRDVGDYGEDERDANRFASALLMPSEYVRGIVQNLEDEYPKCPTSFIISEVARRFGVSESAAEVRLTRLEQI